MILIKELDRRFIGTHGNKTRFALFQCEHCGKIVEKQKANGIRDLSCGCARYTLASTSNTLHGDSKKTSEYYNLFGIWAGMRDRCNRKTSQDYQYYGDKGIIVSEEWDDYSNFKKWSLLNGYISKCNLQIDRVDGNKNYSPPNCRWVEPKINQRNRDCILLNEDKAEAIRKLNQTGVTIKELSNIYSVSTYTIWDVIKGRTWKH